MVSASRSFLTGGSCRSLREVGRFGRPLHAFYVPLRELVTREVGAEAAALLAEPLIDEQRRTVDWYTSLPGQPVAYAQLAPAERDRVRGRVHESLTRLRELGERCTRDRDPVRQGLGGALLDAATVPAESDVFVVGGCPVMAFWGFVLEDRVADGSTDLVALLDAPPARAAAPSLGADGSALPASRVPPCAAADPARLEPAVAAAARVPTPPPSGATVLDRTLYVVVGARVFWSVVCASLALLALAFLLWLAAVLFRPAPPRDIAAALAAAHQEEALLRGQLEQLTRDYMSQRLRCSAALVIPPRPVDVSFLAGRWISITGLSGTQTGKPVVVEYVFDAAGRGTKTVLEEKGARCTAPVAARLDGETLRIEDKGEAQCPGGRFYARGAVVCRTAPGGEATCKGTQEGGQDYGVTLRRAV